MSKLSDGYRKQLREATTRHPRNPVDLDEALQLLIDQAVAVTHAYRGTAAIGYTVPLSVTLRELERRYRDVERLRLP